MVVLAGRQLQVITENLSRLTVGASQPLTTCQGSTWMASCRWRPILFSLCPMSGPPFQLEPHLFNGFGVRRYPLILFKTGALRRLGARWCRVSRPRLRGLQLMIKSAGPVRVKFDNDVGRP